jgi:hypothetical protein
MRASFASGTRAGEFRDDDGFIRLFLRWAIASRPIADDNVAGRERQNPDLKTIIPIDIKLNI